MSQHTLHGFGQREDPESLAGAFESRFVPIGARVGQSGQVYETDGAGELVVKLFTWGAGLPEQAVQNFTRDAMRVANLRHPHVAQVLDAGVLGDGTPFLVMERLAGMTLQEAMDRGPRASADVLPILRGVSSALAAAHAAGVAHGEVRADNVFIVDPTGSGPGCAKLLDFGVARLRAGERPQLELGTRAGERADQLAFAALAWQLFGGGASAGLQRVLLLAMNPDPSQRFGTIAELVDALEDASASAAAPPPPLVRHVAPAAPPPSLTQQFFAEGEQLEKAHATAAAQADDDNADDDNDLVPAAPARVPRSRAQMILVAALALGSVAVLAWTVVSLISKPAESPAAAVPPPIASPRPVVVATAGARAPVRTMDRGQRGRPAVARRASTVQPPPFAAPRPSVVATSNAPAPREIPPPIPAPLPPPGFPGREGSPAPVAAASAPSEASGPPLAIPAPAEAPPPSSDRAAPPAEPAPSDEASEPAESSDTEPPGAAP